MEHCIDFKPTADCDYVLTADKLTKKYGQFTALNDFSIHIPKGSIYGFVGKNGAGKTTLIRIICGLQEPTSGSYSLYGKENKQKSIADMRCHMGAVVETPSIYLDMTAQENIRQQMYVIGKHCTDSDVTQLLELVGLAGTGKKKARNFSLGMRQRLGIAIALTGNPDFLVLDEPTNGLDPQGIIEIRDLIIKLNRERHITVLISSHILDELSRLATHYGFIDSGHMLSEISAQQLEEACRKSTHITVTDIAALKRVLDSFGVEYSASSYQEADIYAHMNVTKLVMALHEQGCEVLSLSENEENLESYYINLLSGKRA